MKATHISAAGLSILALCLFSTAGEITVNPSERYQIIDGFGAHGNGDISMAVNDLGMTIHRGGCNGGVEGFHRTSYAAAQANGDEMKLMLSVWTPPSNMKIGPFAERNMRITITLNANQYNIRY